MIFKIHHTDLAELMQILLASFFYFWMIGEVEAAEEFGEQFDRIYKYDSDNAGNGMDNIHNALNFDWDES